ncbi:hypothetical protein BUZ84_06930 [Mammaliicoccus sciuri]|uniref:hypothetical protein n=1 Tax=Mammaliicoccus sciuri TaxID=1296 RepID=UPI000D1F0915|nr:hypothetical protein [Mammaliicoccus sciuri]PTJ81280.1 hypothetical protein BUZ84_06930 [Mammaliicoccus sciuri]
MVKAMQWLGRNKDEIEEFCPKAKVLGKAQLFVTRNYFKQFSLYLEGKEVLPYGFIVKTGTDKYEIKSEDEFYAEYEVDTQ